jgi:hypothetical protein
MPVNARSTERHIPEDDILQLDNLYPLSGIIRVTKSRRIRAGCIVGKGEMRHAVH